MKIQTLQTYAASEKALILCGPAASNKIDVAIQIAAKRGRYKVEPEIKDFMDWPSCQPETRTIIFSHCPADLNYEQFFNYIFNPIRINPRGEESFNVQLKFIFCTEFRPTISGQSFDRRFDVAVDNNRQF